MGYLHKGKAFGVNHQVKVVKNEIHGRWGLKNGMGRPF